jgi:tetratricopeptide (TPR) repeat protein
MIHDLGTLSQRWQNRLPYCALISAVFAAYSNVYGNAFLFDDGLVITRNTFLLSWQTFGALLTASTTEGAHISGGFYRPLQNILYFFVYHVFGESRFGFHLLNVSLHATNACLLYKLGCKLKFKTISTLLATLIWALHPIHTEAVTYMSATADSLHTLFCLLGIVVLLPDVTQRKIYISVPLFILGLLSKETAIVFPLLVVVTIFLKDEHRYRWQSYLCTWPLWILMIAYISWRMTNTSLDGPQTYERVYDLPDYHNLKLYAGEPLWRLYTFLATLPAYLSLLVWPTGLHMERSFMIFANFLLVKVQIGLALCLMALGQIIWGAWRRRLSLSWGLLWFAAAHAPDTGLIFPINSLFLEHWMYLPTTGLFLGLGQHLGEELRHPRWLPFRPTVVACAVSVAFILGICTFEQNEVWHDPVTFYTHMFKFGVVSARAHNNLALAYGERGDFPAAIGEFNKAIAITDTYAETRHNLALAVLNVSDRDAHIPEAIDDLNRALQIDPTFYRSYQALAQIYAYLGRKERAYGDGQTAQADDERSAFYKQKGEALLNSRGP